MATFGSSFNVCDRQEALKEVSEFLTLKVVHLGNHRDLNEFTQALNETIIREGVDGYGYGTRREDQEGVIGASGLLVRSFTLIQSDP